MPWNTLRQFPLLVWIVILGTFMVRTSFFMVWPFLSILLYREYDLSASCIGMLLGGAAVLSSLIGFYVGGFPTRLAAAPSCCWAVPCRVEPTCCLVLATLFG